MDTIYLLPGEERCVDFRDHPQTKRPPSKIALGERSGIVFGFARRLRTECHALRSQAGAAKG